MAKRIKVNYLDYLNTLKDSSNWKDNVLFSSWLIFNQLHIGRTLKQNAYAFCKQEGLCNKALLFSHPDMSDVLKTQWINV